MIGPAGEPHPYGYLWWLGDLAGYPTFSARGGGGQVVLVMPDLQVTVVSLSDPDFGHPSRRSVASQFTQAHVIPLVEAWIRQ